MKYLILIASNARSRATWQSFSADEQKAGLAAYAELHEDLLASGELVVAEALAGPEAGRRLPASVPGWETDGPFAEAKEQLAGFFLVECDGLDRAAEIAARIPEASLGLVEVRPCQAPGGLEM